MIWYQIAPKRAPISAAVAAAASPATVLPAVSPPGCMAMRSCSRAPTCPSAAEVTPQATLVTGQEVTPIIGSV